MSSTFNPLIPPHSPAPWLNNEGMIETDDGRTIAMVYQPGDFPHLNDADFRRAEAECESNAWMITASPALFHNLRYAVWLLEHQREDVTPAALATMKAALALANPVKGGVE